MSFYFELYDDNGNYHEPRQHIQLSLFAWSIIDTDISVFLQCSDAFSQRRAFLNRVFRGMYHSHTSPANLTSSLHSQRDLLDTALRRRTDFPDSIKLFSLLSDTYANKYKPLFDAADATESYKLRIDSETNAILHEMGERSFEEKVFKKLCYYFKEVFETYARFSSAERERIYYWEKFDKIQSAIDQRHILTYKLDKEWRVKPLELLPDNYGQHYYLIGYECLETSSTGRSEPFSTRLTNISDPRDRAEKFRFKDSEIKAIKKDLVQKGGPAYLRQKCELFTIKLTQNGMRKYNTITYLRPPYISCESIKDDKRWKYRLTFEITPFRFRSYFERFLADAFVESPLDMRENFYRYCKNALELYNPTSD